MKEGIAWIGVCIAILGAGLFVLTQCNELPAARTTLGVHANHFEAATKEAMGLINNAIGCKFFVPGDEVLVTSATGAPCGDPWRPPREEGHAGTAYRCSKTRDYFEIHVSRPGDTHTQTCIIMHELLHVAGIRDSTKGVMNQYVCQRHIRMSDEDTDTLKRAVCN